MEIGFKLIEKIYETMKNNEDKEKKRQEEDDSKHKKDFHQSEMEICTDKK